MGVLPLAVVKAMAPDMVVVTKKISFVFHSFILAICEVLKMNEFGINFVLLKFDGWVDVVIANSGAFVGGVPITAAMGGAAVSVATITRVVVVRGS